MPIRLSKPRRVGRYVGERYVPQDVKRRRHQVYEMMRRMGNPVVVKHRYNDLDVQNGIAVKSPVFDDVYGQTRNEDPISHGVGYVSAELAPNEWYDQNGVIIKSNSNPGSGYTQAPLYRGFGKGYQTWVILPDKAEDFYKAFTGGPLFKVQEATAIAPWYPNIDDNDLVADVSLNRTGGIGSINALYEAKMVNPVSIRGLDRSGQNIGQEDASNRFTVNQQFALARVPHSNQSYWEVEFDR